MNTARIAGRGGEVLWRARIAACASVGAVMLACTAAEGQCQGRWAKIDATLGTDGTVYAMAKLPNGDLVAGGTFTVAGGVGANHVAVYSPASKTWSPLGKGVDGDVYCLLTLSDGDIVVGGSFSNAGSTAASDIARYSWATAKWSTLDQGTNGVVYALAETLDGDVIAGGIFNDASGVDGTHYIARYDWGTNSWWPLKHGLNSYVLSLLTTPAGNIIIGGGFDMAGGSDCDHVVSYQPKGDTWLPLGLGLGNDVHSLLQLPSGDLIAGGVFTSTGDTKANRVARYDAANDKWVSLGTGTNAGVYALAMQGNQLILGGAFTDRGSRVCSYSLATGTWGQLGSGVSDTVLSLLSLPLGDLMVGGNFMLAGDDVAMHLAKWMSGPTIVKQPTAATQCPVGTACFAVAATGEGDFKYEWQIEGKPGIWTTLGALPAPLPGGGTAFATGADQNVTDIGVRNRLGVVNVRCLVTDGCGTVASDVVPLTNCVGDFDCSGISTVQDVFTYLAAWFAGDVAADVNGYSGVDLQDLFDFLSGWYDICG